MKYLEYNVKNMGLTKDPKDKTVLVSGAVNYFGLHFNFDEEFGSIEGVKSVEFFKNRNRERIDIVDGYCTLPNWLIKDKMPFEMRVVSGTVIGTPWLTVSGITEGGIIETDKPEDDVPEGTEYVKSIKGDNSIGMLRDNNGIAEYSKDGNTWKQLGSISDNEFNSMANAYLTKHGITGGSSGEEVSKSGTAGTYSTSAFLGDKFTVIPTSEAFVSSGNFLRFTGVGTTGNNTPLIEGEPVAWNGAEITLNEDGSVTINGTPTSTFYILTNITSAFRTAIIGQIAKVSMTKSDDTVTLTLGTGFAFNDATYAYNITKTGSYNGLVTADKITSESKVTVTSGVAYDNLTVSAMLELQNDKGYLTEYTKSDCEVITASTEYSITNYPIIGIVGEHTITYKTEGGSESLNTEEIEKLKASNTLYGKKVSCIGDSLCYGQGFTGGYCTILSELEPNTTFINKGVGGSQISSNHANGGNWHIENQLSGVAEDTDYIVCEGYVNDYLTDCELGVITDGYEAELDTTTFYGGMESLCKTLANNYTDKRYGFIIAHSHYSADSAYDNALYIEAVKECCDKWGVPYLDLSAIITPIVPIYKSTYYTDGLHYNEAGYRRITPAIREWIKSL